MNTIWNFVTDFGDSSITLSLALLTFGVLVALRSQRVAASWALAIGGCAVATALLKFALQSCGHSLLGAGVLTNPSGHAAMSTAVYGSFAIVLGSSLRAPGRRAVFVASIALALAIAVSRVALNDHTAAEVATGLGIGLGAVALFRWTLAPVPATPVNTWLLASSALIIVAALHGTRLPIEHVIRTLVSLFHASGRCT